MKAVASLFAAVLKMIHFLRESSIAAKTLAISDHEIFYDESSSRQYSLMTFAILTNG